MTKSAPKIRPVILSGGQGKRLWPLSRSNQPKQFIPLTSEKSLFEDTVERCMNVEVFAEPLILCAQEHRFLVKKLLPKDSAARIIMEPCGKNTAAAICAAALASDEDEILLVLPSDHYIPDTPAFTETIQKALPLAQNGDIVTFGVKPTSPHTGFGYIERGEKNGTGFSVKQFHEKPDLSKAQNYIKQGGFFWNAGIFMMRASTLLDEIKNHTPDILKGVKAAYNNAIDDLNDTLLSPQDFQNVRSESIDYAVLEKTDKAVVIPAKFKWNDLGSWTALWDISTKNSKENYTEGKVYTDETTGSYLRSKGPVLGVIGMKDIVAIAMPDAVFVAPKEKSEEVKELVAQMSASGQNQVTENQKTLRPWGSYEVMEENPGFKVKKLTVDANCRLSLQKHEHRSEHWVVVKGTATVTSDDEVFDLKTNESAYIPCGTVHRLENKTQEPLEIIEVQTGDYLGEDDIIRLEDDYNRNEIKNDKAINQ